MNNHYSRAKPKALGSFDSNKKDDVALVLQSLFKKLSLCRRCDRHLLSRQIKKIEGLKIASQAAKITEIEKKIQASIAHKEALQKALITPVYPPELPVSAKKDELLELIKNHQVVVICGETGSGKSTQLPKLCLELGYGVDGLIAQTQPRRIAARSVASRIASELDSELGDKVGFKVRFNEKISSANYIRVMTDGMLVAELEQDRFLNQYDVIIIDEAHERSMNIDVLCGYLKGVLKKRPELKLLITSATIDPQQFASFFVNEKGHKAPIIEISGRTFPVEIRYQPLPESRQMGDDDLSLRHFRNTVEECFRQGAGDILAFFSGEREIRMHADDVSKKLSRLNIEVLPLYARLSLKEQQAIFKSSHRRRLILATNIAETSLTVPNIGYVIDSGLARIARFNPNRKIQRIPIEKISQASANQRSGRCGRISDGVCYRLYDEEDFSQRDEFESPEILRNSLASVLLSLHGLKIKNIENFPWISAPPLKLVKDAERLLVELGGVDINGVLTTMGKKLVRLPLDPRMGRMLLAGDEFHCLEIMIIIAAYLSTQDPRYSPADQRDAARQKHRIFQHKQSDFISIIILWNTFKAESKALSNRKLRQWCDDHYISWLAMLEWKNVVHELRSMARQLKLKLAPMVELDKAQEDQVHQAILTGFLGNIAFLAPLTEQPKSSDSSKSRSRQRHYLGAHGKKLTIFPGSVLSQSSTNWIMSADVVETSAIYARTVAPIQPQWIENIAQHLLNFTYSDPYWQPRQGRVLCYRKSSLYGLNIQANKKVDYSEISPDHAHEIFITQALVHAQVIPEQLNQYQFLSHNQALISYAKGLEAKFRQTGFLKDEYSLYECYAKIIPTDISRIVDFNKWLKKQSSQQSLYWQLEDVLNQDVENIKTSHPDRIVINQIPLDLIYLFDPNDEADGIQINLPLFQLNQIQVETLDGLIPGWVNQKIGLLIKGLPKQIKRQLGSASELIEQANTLLIGLSENDYYKASLLQRLTALITDQYQVNVNLEDWPVKSLPDYLRIRLQLLNEKGQVIAASRDLKALKEQYGLKSQHAFAQTIATVDEQSGLTQWSFESLPEKQLINKNNQQFYGYPAIVDQLDSVAIKLVENKAKANQLSFDGVLRLLMLDQKESIRYILTKLNDFKQARSLYISIGDVNEFFNEFLRQCFIDVFYSQGVPSTQDEFMQALKSKSQLINQATEKASILLQTLKMYHEINSQLASMDENKYPQLIAQIQDHLQWLVYDGFVGETPVKWLEQFPKYLKAAQLRLERAINNGLKDDQKAKIIAPYWDAYTQCLESPEAYKIDAIALAEYGWMLEEFRVSLFAQELKTIIPVSEKKISQQLKIAIN